MNYVIAAWGGARRDKLTPSTPYLRQHLERLTEIRSPIAQVTVVAPKNDDPPEFLAALEYARWLGAVVFRPKNIGLSYGAWNHAWKEFRDSGFKWWIFMEDDYAPVAHGFDQKLIKLYEEKMSECGGYLCAVAVDNESHGLHAANSNGITEQRCLEAIDDRFGCLPHNDRESGYRAEDGQVRFSRAFLSAGMEIKDIGSEYRTRVWQSSRYRTFYGKNNKEIFEPLQKVSAYV